MLLRETLQAVLAAPSAGEVAHHEVTRLFQPAWKAEAASHALVLTGVRRCGKSTLQGQIRRGIQGASVTINLEDTRLYGLGPGDFATIMSILDDEHPKAAIYLDEVQEVPEWQRLVRALLDSGRRVCLTGSNASLLGREMGSKLTGRHLSHEIYPFSFYEFLEFTGQKPNAASLEDYLRRGGFASALRVGPEHGAVLLRELLRDLVHRDIVTRHSLRTARPLMTLALHLLAHPGQPLSLQALSKGLGLPSVAQTGRMVEYLRDAWLLLSLPRFSASFKQRVTSPPKYYAVDTGMAAANSPNPTPDLGRKLENAVLIALRRMGAAPTFAAAPHEWVCDFVTADLAIQCCARLTPENRQRELLGLLQAAKLPGSSKKGGRELCVITLDQEDALTEEGHDVHVIPAWKWLD
ncbi:MAG: ATP-binding protein [Verrucomicrobiota bacterium]